MPVFAKAVYRVRMRVKSNLKQTADFNEAIEEA